MGLRARHRMKIRIRRRPETTLVVVGFFHLCLLKSFLILINQLFCFLCCFSFLALGQLVMETLFPCKGMKAEISHYHLNANLLHLPSSWSREENQWCKHTFSLPGDKKPLGLDYKRFFFYSETVLAQKNPTQARIFWNISFFCLVFFLGGGVSLWTHHFSSFWASSAMASKHHSI